MDWFTKMCESKERLIHGNIAHENSQNCVIHNYFWIREKYVNIQKSQDYVISPISLKIMRTDENIWIVKNVNLCATNNL